MNSFFQTITLIFMIFIILWLIAGAQLFTEVNKCKNLTMTDCLNNKNCKFITSSQDFRVSECIENKKDIIADGKRTYSNDDYTRSLISNDNLYRDINKPVFD